MPKFLIEITVSPTPDPSHYLRRSTTIVYPYITKIIPEIMLALQTLNTASEPIDDKPK